LQVGGAPLSIFGKGTTEVAYGVVDAAGLSSTCVFNVTVVDNEAPNISKLDELILNNVLQKIILCD
jgi:hypothetical protein